MKKLLFLAMGFALTTQMIMAQLPSYVPTSGLVGYWPFNGNANDANGNVNNGTVNGATLTNDRFGNVNSAYNFNGVNSNINVPNSSNLNFGTSSNFSISTWINFNAINASKFNGIISKGTLSSYIYQLGCYDNLISCEYGNSALMNFKSLECSQKLQINSWYLMTMVVDRNLNFVKLYLNNNLVNTFSNPNIKNENITSTTSLKIGVERGFNNFFNGKIDDVGIWNRALTQEEITQLYYSDNTCQSLVINTGVLGFNPITYNNTVTIYPNPANNQITIDCGNLANVSGWNIKIYNTLSQEVFSGAMNQQKHTIPLNTWGGQGVYFVKIYDGSNNLMNTKKIILQ